MDRGDSRFRRALAAVGDESGMALMMVVAVSAIMFLLLTTVIALVTYHQTQTTRYSARTQAMHIADAGLNEYLYNLSRQGKTYGTANPTVGPIQMEDGSWTIQCTPEQNGTPMTLRSVGSLASGDASRTIRATVRWPTFAEYMFLFNNVSTGDWLVGAQATIYGKVRCNGNIDNAGRITGLATAGGKVIARPGSRFDAGYRQNAPLVDFAQVSTSLLGIANAATSSGTYFPASGATGYYVVFRGSVADIYKITGTIDTTKGVLSTQRTFVSTKAIPASGVFYFDDKVWVSGTYAARVTVASSSDIRVPDNLVPSDMNSFFTMGLVAKNNVLIPTSYASMPTNLTVVAAMLAQSGSFGGEYVGGYKKNLATIRGSVAAQRSAGLCQVDGSGNVTAGFLDRDYYYDARLEQNPPPMYPEIKEGSLKVSTWLEN